MTFFPLLYFPLDNNNILTYIVFILNNLKKMIIDVPSKIAAKHKQLHKFGNTANRNSLYTNSLFYITNF